MANKKAPKKKAAKAKKPAAKNPAAKKAAVKAPAAKKEKAPKDAPKDESVDKTPEIKPASMDQVTQPRGDLLTVYNSGMFPAPMQIGNEKRKLAPKARLLTMSVEFTDHEIRCLALVVNDKNETIEKRVVIPYRSGLVVTANNNTLVS